MSIFRAIHMSASGLTAERTRMDVIAQNIANANTTRTQSGDPYRRKVIIFREAKVESSFQDILRKKEIRRSGSKGVEISGIVEDRSAFRRIYDPGHPEADQNGYVMMSNVDPVTEMVDMISATRAYEANATALSSSKNMLLKALEIGK